MLRAFACFTLLMLSFITSPVVAQTFVQIEPWETKIRQQLARPTAFDFDETPLDEVVEFLQQQHGVQFILDQSSLDDIGIGPDFPVSLRIRGTTVAQGVSHLLHRIDPELTWTIQPNVILVTTKETAAEHLWTRVYNVTSLLRSMSGRHLGTMSDFDSLISIVTETIDDETWLESGGEGTIVELEHPQVDLLVVSQTYNVHLEIERLFALIATQLPPRPKLSTQASSLLSGSRLRPVGQATRVEF